MAKRLGIVPHLFAQPLVYGLKVQSGSAGELGFRCEEDHYAQLALRLRQNDLDGAFLSPIELARNYPHWRVLPNCGVVSEGESRSVMLMFREQLRELKTIAIDPAFPSEVVLTSIVLREKYGVEPQFIPRSGSLAENLADADAVLAVDRAAGAGRDYVNTLDLVDEWFDMTEMSFVHGLWITRENALTADEMKAIRERRLSIDKLPELNAEEREFLEGFRFEVDDAAVAALHEFFRMAYYHGILSDLPDVKFETL